jgi:hypothetical protein
MAFAQVAYLVLEIFDHDNVNSPYPPPIVNLRGVRAAQNQ